MASSNLSAIGRLLDEARMLEERGALPRREDGTVDLHKVDRLLRAMAQPSARVRLLKRLAASGGEPRAGARPGPVPPPTAL